MRQIIEDKQTKFLGFVNNLPKSLSNAAVLVCPLRFAAGVQNKILQAMALGVPVVTTSLGNEGIGAKPGEEILIAKSNSDFAKKVASLLRDNNLRNKIGLNGKKFVKNKFDWSVFAKRAKKIEDGLDKPV